MKERIKVIIACVLLVGSMAFAFQKQDSAPKPKRADEKININSVENLAREVEAARREIEKSKREFDYEMKKRDSIDTERRVNIDIANRSVNDLRKANQAYKKSLGRLVYVVGRFNPDSVMKYYSEYLDPEDVKIDTTKKKIEYPEIEVPKPKRSFWKRLFGHN